MLDKVRGLVFRSIPFGESSLILQIFTEELGLQSFILKGAKKPKKGQSALALQALQPVEMVAYPPKSGEIYQIKEIKTFAVYQNIPFNIVKTSLILFLDEVLIKSIRQHQKDTALYHFIYNALFLLDVSEGSQANFHILFMLQLCRYLGFYPSLDFLETLDLSGTGNPLFFDLKNGSFLSGPPLHPSYIGTPYSLYLYQLWTLNFETGEDFSLSRTERIKILEILIEYYRFHIDGFGSIKSLEVLVQVFDEKD